MSNSFNVKETLVATNREWKQLALRVPYSLYTAGDSLQKTVGLLFSKRENGQ